MGADQEGAEHGVFHHRNSGRSFFSERDFVPGGSLLGIHESGGRDARDRKKRTAYVFCGISANGNEFVDILLFAVCFMCKKISVHIAFAECYFEQFGNSYVSVGVWRRQPVACDACCGSGCAGVECGVFSAIADGIEFLENYMM